MAMLNCNAVLIRTFSGHRQDRGEQRLRTQCSGADPGRDQPRRLPASHQFLCRPRSDVQLGQKASALAGLVDRARSDGTGRHLPADP